MKSVRFRLNFAPYKSEVVERWCGEKSRTCRAQLEQTHNCKVLMARGNRSVHIDVVQRYKHMGTQTSAAGNLGQEVVGSIIRSLA